jgi:hypothetical protein
MLNKAFNTYLTGGKRNTKGVSASGKILLVIERWTERDSEARCFNVSQSQDMLHHVDASPIVGIQLWREEQ